MIAAYLYLNSALYAVFALWCTVQWKNTSANLGYRSLDNSGSSEYLVIYGGLQWGLAASFFWLANDPALRITGLRLALAIYIPIVVYRLVTIWQFQPVSGMTKLVGAMEVALLLAALVLFLQVPGRN